MIEVKGVRKSFGGGPDGGGKGSGGGKDGDGARSAGQALVLDNVDLSITEGEFFCLLGPSGCGKTTLLRVIAGLETPEAGTIAVGGKDVTGAQPHKRGCALVFQNYALWPHLTVRENIVYGLEVRRAAKAEVRAVLAESLRAYQLEGLEERYPHQLSGGQQQRVALARAMAVHPHAVLMDEPLSNLDAALRKSLRRELLEFHRRSRNTVLYVTHDQEEALALSDRIAVMMQGRILEVGRPEALYSRPRNPETALFLGDMNVLKGGSIPTALRKPSDPSDAGTLCIRPENVRVRSEAAPDFAGLEGVLAFKEFLGSHANLGVETSAGRILVRVGIGEAERFAPGAHVYLEFPPEHRLWY